MAKYVSTNALMIVRLRGGISTIPKIKETLRHLRLNKVMHAVVIPGNKHFRGMLQVVKDYVTWGEVDDKTLVEVIKKRGKLLGNKPVTDGHVKDVTDFKTVNDFVAAIIKGKARYSDLKDVKPLFRLSPPKGGLKSTKQHFTIGGDLGYRGDAINDLVSRMLGVALAPKPKEEKPKAKAAPKKIVKKAVKKKVAKKKE